MPRNILITGGAGFIGYRLVYAILAAEPDSHIWVYDCLHPQVHGINARPPEFPASVRFVKGDIANKDMFEAVITESMPELIYHLAAETGTGQSFDELSRYCGVNVMGTVNLIESVRSASANSTRSIILAASRAVYGEGAYEDSTGRVYVGLPRQEEALMSADFNVPLPEEATLPVKACPSRAGLPVAPASIYASTKLMQEYLLCQSGEGANWRTASLRLQNVYGPGQSLRNPYTGVLSIFAKQLLEGKTLSIFEDGRISRDFVYVDDVVDALVRAGQFELNHGTTIDIGSGEAVSILDVARILMRHLGCPDDNYRITGDFRVGDIRHACADIGAASKQLDWKPQVSIEDGLAALTVWARQEFETNNWSD